MSVTILFVSSDNWGPFTLNVKCVFLVILKQLPLKKAIKKIHKNKNKTLQSRKYVINLKFVVKVGHFEVNTTTNTD